MTCLRYLLRGYAFFSALDSICAQRSCAIDDQDVCSMLQTLNREPASGKSAAFHDIKGLAPVPETTGEMNRSIKLHEVRSSARRRLLFARSVLGDSVPNRTSLGAARPHSELVFSIGRLLKQHLLSTKQALVQSLIARRESNLSALAAVAAIAVVALFLGVIACANRDLHWDSIQEESADLDGSAGTPEDGGQAARAEMRRAMVERLGGAHTTSQPEPANDECVFRCCG